MPVACALAIDVSADYRARTTVRFQLIGSFFAGNSELFWDLSTMGTTIATPVQK